VPTRRWLARGCRGAEQTTEAWGERESALKPQLVVGRLGEESQGRQPESGNQTFRDEKGAPGKRGHSGSADLSRRGSPKGFGSTGGLPGSHRGARARVLPSGYSQGQILKYPRPEPGWSSPQSPLHLPILPSSPFKRTRPALNLFGTEVRHGSRSPEYELYCG
jgi:hypothetical protein